MSRTRHVVFLQTDRCRIATVEGSSVRWTDCSSDASAIASALRATSYRGEPILLALGAMMCLPAPIPLEGIGPRDRKAMLFRLEEQLPIAAEEFVADFVIHDDRALGVAVRLDLLKSLVTALESEGVRVASVTPAAMLALAAMNPSDGVVRIREEDRVNVISLEHGAPVRWNLVPATDTEIREIDDSAARQGAKVLSGAARPILELRRDALAPADRLDSVRGALNLLLASAAVLLLALAGAELALAHRYDSAASAFEGALAGDFHSAFPGWETANIPAVIESEHSKLAATDTTKLPPEARRSALRTLRDIVASLPSNGAFVVDRMTFEDTSFELEGHATSLQDVDTLAKSARTAGMDVSPPQSRREDDGRWSFTVRGSKLSATASVPTEAR
jgi:type II secretory pathway component PulL